MSDLTPYVEKAKVVVIFTDYNGEAYRTEQELRFVPRMPSVAGDLVAREVAVWLPKAMQYQVSTGFGRIPTKEPQDD